VASALAISTGKELRASKSVTGISFILTRQPLGPGWAGLAARDRSRARGAKSLPLKYPPVLVLSLGFFEPTGFESSSLCGKPLLPQHAGQN